MKPGDVLDRPRHRADRVERGAHVERAPVGDRAVGGAQAAHAAERGRDPDRPARIRAEGADAEVGGEGRGRPAARPAGHPLAVPGIAAGAERGRVGRRRAVGELVEIRLSEHDRAGLPKSRDGGRVSGGDPAFEETRGTGRPCAGHVEQVLDGDRHAVEGERPAGCACLVGPPRVRERELGRDRDECVQERVEHADAVEQRLGESHRGHGYPPARVVDDRPKLLRRQRQPGDRHVTVTGPSRSRRISSGSASMPARVERQSSMAAA